MSFITVLIIFKSSDICFRLYNIFPLCVNMFGCECFRCERLSPNLITTHCMAHCQQLLTEKAANRCPLIIKYIAVLNTFIKALKYSLKLCQLLESSKELYGEDACKVKQVSMYHPTDPDSENAHSYIYNEVFTIRFIM